MKSPVRIAVPLLAAALFLAPIYAQPASQDQPQQDGGMGGLQIEEHSVRGDITAISGSTLTIKTDEGETYSVATGPNTRIRKQRGPIKLTDLHIGDMIAAVGDKDPKTKTLGAMFVVFIDKQQYQKIRADFGKTWTTGVVQSIDGTNIIVKRPDNITQTVAVDENTSFRRRREDITLPDIKTGDNITARGTLQNGTFLATVVNIGGPGRFGDRSGAGHHPDSSPAPDSNPPQSEN